MVRVLLFSVFPLVYFGTYFLFIYQYLIKRYNLLYAMEKIRFSRSRRNFETSSFSLALVPLHSQIKYILFLLFKSNSFVCALSLLTPFLLKETHSPFNDKFSRHCVWSGRSQQRPLSNRQICICKNIYDIQCKKLGHIIKLDSYLSII